MPAGGLSQHVGKTRNLPKSFTKALPQAVTFKMSPEACRAPQQATAEADAEGGCAPVGAKVLQCLPRAGS